MTRFPRPPWVWREFSGKYELFTAHGGSQVVLTGKIFVRDEDGVLEMITPEHPVAEMLRAAPELAKLLEKALTWEGRLNQAEQMTGQNYGMMVSEARELRSSVTEEQAAARALLARVNDAQNKES